MPAVAKKKPGRPVDQQKTLQVFNAIDTILAEQGVTGLSIEGIARVAGIGKATLYRRFSDLNGVINAYVETFMHGAIAPSLMRSRSDFSDPEVLESVLNEFGLALIKLICQPRVIAFDNAILSAGGSLSSLKQGIYQKGPQQAITQIANVLEQAGVTSPLFNRSQLADVLFHIWRSGIYDQALVTGKMSLNDEQLASHVVSGTRFFLASVL